MLSPNMIAKFLPSALSFLAGAKTEVNKMRMNFSHCWSRANSKERERLAKLAGTGRNYLDQVAGGHRTFSVEMAGKVERAMKQMSLSGSSAWMPPLTRGELHEVCKACNYYKNG